MNLLQSEKYQAGTFWIMVACESAFVVAKVAGWTTWSWWFLLIAPIVVFLAAVLLGAFFSGCGGMMLMMAFGAMLVGKILGDLTVSWWIVAAPLFALFAFYVVVLLTTHFTETGGRGDDRFD